jgi:predicted permease
VEAVTFSQVGLYTGSFSTAPIEVEGSAATAERLSESELDRLGTDYFTTLGVPLRLGRDITDADRADSRLVCVINEAFVRRYFDGRHPIGLHVTTVEGDERRAYEVVGVAGDARTRSPRDEPEPRFFVPSEQRPSSGTNRTFVIRASRVSPTVAASVRAATGEVDAALSVSEIASIEKQMAPLTAEERGIARLAMVFGITALALAAFGIYGVLSYGVSRRSDEIAIRLALGAKVGGVVWMILRESLWLVLGGIAVGGVLAFYAPRIIASRLYGIAPEDPLTFVLATLALLLVAVGSAYWPARRASRVDPMIALHQG